MARGFEARGHLSDPSPTLDGLTMTLSTTHSGATSIEVAKRGMASVAQSRETKASSARQFCFSGSAKIWSDDIIASVVGETQSCAASRHSGQAISRGCWGDTPAPLIPPHTHLD